jgi:hypothetical protein
MANKVLVFHLTPEQLQTKADFLKEQGITISLPKGDIQHKTPIGTVEVGYEYDGKSQLSVTILKNPPFCEGRVVSEINKWFAEG